MVGAVGLLATLGDEFVGPELLGQMAATEENVGKPIKAEFHAESGCGGADKGEHRNAGRGLRECLSDMAKKFFQGANKVRKANMQAKHRL